MDEPAVLPRLHWTQGPLYKKLMDIFPDYRTKQQQVLDVPRLRQDLNMSEEGLYKRLRAGNLTPRLVRKIVELANGAENVAALRKNRRDPPKVEDFTSFLFN